MSECVVCGGNDYELQDGLYFCSECGTQSQNAREEIAEEFPDSAFRRKVARETSAIDREIRNRKRKRGRLGMGEIDEETGEVIHLHQLEKFQFILKKQANALIKLGFDKSVKEAVKLIWFIYLKHYGYAFSDGTATDGKENKTPGENGKAGGTGRGGKKTPKQATGSARSSVGGTRSAYDSFPDDAQLFDDSVKLEEDKDGTVGEEEEEDVWKRMWDTPESRYRCCHTMMNQYATEYFVLRYTVSVLYLAILYSGHHVLLVDLLRLLANNSIPYYNIATMVPRSLCTARDPFNHVKPLCTAYGIYLFTVKFYSRVPLPPLPVPDPVQVCRVLTDRLQLPVYVVERGSVGSNHRYANPVQNLLGCSECIQWMVDKAVTCLYVPKFMKRDTDSAGSLIGRRRIDVQGLAVIIMVLRLVYRLDDQFEMCQTTASESIDQSQLSPTHAVYAWMDWVHLYLHHIHQSQAEGVPINDSELERLRNYRKYLDFCREGIYLLRGIPLKGENYHQFHNRQWTTSLSQIFVTHNKRVIKAKQQLHTELHGQAHTAITDSGTHHGQRLCQSFSPFKPRLVPVDLTVHGAKASENYETLHKTKISCYLHDVPLSQSMTFLLSICGELVSAEPGLLYDVLCDVQGVFFEGVAVPLDVIMVSLAQKKCTT